MLFDQMENSKRQPTTMTKECKRRSTPRAQTPAATYLRDVKPSSYAWNNLPQNVAQYPLFYIRSILKILWKSFLRFPFMFVTNRQTHKRTEVKT